METTSPPAQPPLPPPNRSRVRWLLLLPILALIFAQRFLWRDEPSCLDCRDAARLLIASGTLRSELEGVLRPTLQELAPRRAIVINGAYRSDALVVYLTDAELLASREGDTRIAGHRLSEIVRNNFVAISPNIIVIDDAFLSMLVATAFNDGVGYTQATMYTRNIPVTLESKILSPEVQRVMHISEMFAAAATYQQYTNVLAILDPAEERDSWREVAKGLASMWDDGERIDTDPGGTRKLMQRMFVTSLGPVFAHELGHLDHGQSGQLAASGLLGSIAVVTQRDAERQADLYAARFMERRLEEIRRVNGDNEALFSFEAQPLFWFVKLLRELALAEAFHDFRGLTAQDALMSIEHRGCAKAPTLYPINAGDFWRSEQNEIPVLTESEWQTMRERMLRRRATASHDDAIMRARDILARLDENFVPAVASVLEYIKFFDAITKDDPTILERDPMPGIGMNASTFMQKFTGLGTFERAAGFGTNRTHIAVLPGGGYVEVRGNDEMEYLRAVMHRPFGDDKALKINIHNTIAMVNLAASVFPDAEGAVQSVQQFFLTNAECRWSSRQTRIGDIGLRFRRLNNSDYFVLEVMHSSQLPEEKVITEADLRALR